MSASRRTEQKAQDVKEQGESTLEWFQNKVKSGWEEAKDAGDEARQKFVDYLSSEKVIIKDTFASMTQITNGYLFGHSQDQLDEQARTAKSKGESYSEDLKGRARVIGDKLQEINETAKDSYIGRKASELWNGLIGTFEDLKDKVTGNE